MINNAGISIDGMNWKLGLDDWNKVLSVNLTGPFLCNKHTLPLMRQSGWGSNPEEIMRCILYLVDEKANYITGQTININGGLY